MSQVDRLHFFSSLFWVVIFFLLWYGFIVSIYFPVYYRVFRGRRMVEHFLWQNINTDQFFLKLIDIFFIVMYDNWIKTFLVSNLVWKFRASSLDLTKRFSEKNQSLLKYTYLYRDKYKLLRVFEKMEDLFLFIETRILAFFPIKKQPKRENNKKIRNEINIKMREIIKEMLIFKSGQMKFSKVNSDYKDVVLKNILKNYLALYFYWKKEKETLSDINSYKVQERNLLNWKNYEFMLKLDKNNDLKIKRDYIKAKFKSTYSYLDRIIKIKKDKMVELQKINKNNINAIKKVLAKNKNKRKTNNKNNIKSLSKDNSKTLNYL